MAGYLFIDQGQNFQPGDLPPKGNDYLAWHDWAEVQRQAGIKQQQCQRCMKWLTPQEKIGHAAMHDVQNIESAAFQALWLGSE